MQGVFATIVYFLCFATSTACAWLLFAAWRRARARLLFWSSLCFAFLAANNLAVVLDLVFLPTSIDLRAERLLLALVALLVLLFGFIWDLEEE